MSLALHVWSLATPLAQVRGRARKRLEKAVKLGCFDAEAALARLGKG